MKAPATEDDPFSTSESDPSSSKTELWASAIAALDAEWSRLAQETNDARQILVHALLSIYNIQSIEDEDELVREGSPVPEGGLCRISGSFLPPIADIKRGLLVVAVSDLTGVQGIRQKKPWLLFHIWPIFSASSLCTWASACPSF
jgi:hypothetical protein